MRYMLPQLVPGMDAERYGLMVSRKMPVAYGALADYSWCGDNGQFGNWNRETGGLQHGFDLDRWLHWLDKVARYAATCAFVVAPDHHGNHLCTCRMYDRYAFPIIERRLPVAFAAQDGAENFIPAFRIDVLFIAGSTTWKLGGGPERLVRRARQLGMPVHIGRINSEERYRRFQLQGATSCDGTWICYGLEANWPRLERVTRQPALLYV